MTRFKNLLRYLGFFTWKNETHSKLITLTVKVMLGYTSMGCLGEIDGNFGHSTGIAKGGMSMLESLNLAFYVFESP